MMLTNVGGCAYTPNNQESEIELDNYIMKTGDILTGPLHLSILPQQSTELANKEYVDKQFDRIVSLLSPLTKETKLLKQNDERLQEKLTDLSSKHGNIEADIVKLHKKITEHSKLVILLSLNLKSAIAKNTNQNKQLKEELEKVSEKNRKLLQHLQQLQSTFQKSVDELSSRITQQVKQMNRMINEVKGLKQKISDLKTLKTNFDNIKVQLAALKTEVKKSEKKIEVNEKEIKVHHTLLDAIDKVQQAINKVTAKLLSIHKRKS